MLKLKKDDDSGLVALNSCFGWLLSGPVAAASSNNKTVTFINTHVMKIDTMRNEDSELAKKVNRFWNLDEMGIKPDERSVYEKFNDEIVFNKGRYVVKLPLKEYRPMIHDNKELAMSRLIKQTERLKKDSEMLELYDNYFKDQINSGILEKVDNYDKGVKNLTTYLPHQAVFDEKKGKSKFHVVLDCSAKQRNGVSLNDILYKGPLMLNSLFELLIKFRLHNVVLTADIRKAYLMISVDESHRDLLRCLWWDNVYKKEPKLQVLRFTRVVFGAAPSQFLLNGTLDVHARRYESVDKSFANKIRNNFYSDDLCTGARKKVTNYIRNLKSVWMKVISILQNGGQMIQNYVN